MVRKAAKVLGICLFVLAMATAFAPVVQSFPVGDSGTCCPEMNSHCVIDGRDILNCYLKKEGGSCNDSQW